MIKILCVVLSALSAASLAVCGVYANIFEYYILQSDTRWSERPESFERSSTFFDLACTDIESIQFLSQYEQRQAKLEAIRPLQKEIVDRNVEQYLDRKVKIIHDELYYVATHYQGTGYGLNMDIEEDADTDLTHSTTMFHASDNLPQDVSHVQNEELVTMPQTTLPTEEYTDTTDVIVIDEHAPYASRFCQKLLNTVSGRQLLNYAYLVRSEAFTEQYFDVDFSEIEGCDLDGRAYCYTYDHTEEQLRNEICNDFESTIRYTLGVMDDQYYEYCRVLDSHASNLNYWAKNASGEIYTNLPSENADPKAILDHKNAFVYNDSSVKSTGIFSEEYFARMIPDLLADNTVYLYLEDEFKPGDEYYAMARFYNLFAMLSPLTVLLLAIACVLLILVCSCVLVALCGHKSTETGITLSFIDKFPTDLHCILSIAMSIGCVLGIYALYTVGIEKHRITYAFAGRFEFKCLALAGMAVCAALAVLSLQEWLTSVVRIKKAHESWLKRCILWKIPVLLWKALRKVGKAFAFLGRKIKNVFVFLLGKPKKVSHVAIFSTAIYFALELLCLAIIGGGMVEWGFAIFLSVLLTVGYTILCVWYLRMIDAIIDASCDRNSLPVKGSEKMPKHLKILAENLSVTSHELDVAVADAVRNERTKAELITNVSHDLKTPLTSVISYVDLLKKCDIKDETAVKYLDILDEKSAKLKRLIEDLIEASKVTTGNVKLVKTPLNLSELAMQAIVEATPDFESNALDLRFSQPENAPIIFADGTKTYRILENLLSNAKKYSAHNSRVYASVLDTDAFGVFEIKNVSREPLDLSPDELMERFVRGDRSRSEDGNGLGLSIAQQLCKLQNGTLSVEIDGDLFKVTVRLPKQKND